MHYKLETPVERRVGLAAGERIWEVMDQINRLDVRPLCTQNRREPDSVYHHLHEAVSAIFRQLDADEDRSWLALLSGRTFTEAVRYGLGEELR